MYKVHPQIFPPNNIKETIWRYFDFTKYISLLDKRSIFFCRVDRLSDAYEMSLPIENFNDNIEFLKENKSSIYKAFSGKLTEDVFLNIIAYIKSTVLVNSWSINKYESAAMWKMYSKSNLGLAITSSFEKLCEAFKYTTDDVLIGIVNYLDYDIEKIEFDTIFGYVMHKFNSYNYENELRAIITNQVDGFTPLFEYGKYVNIDLESLIDKVYIAPNSPEWFYDLVVSTTKKLGYNFEFKKSRLNDKFLK